MARYEKKPVEEWLRETDYKFMGYVPTAEALLFVNFIKEVNAGFEENETPLVHLKMMDGVFNKDRRCAILCHRGIGKTTLFAEYLFLFIAAFNYLPGFGKVDLILYVTDSIENGVKNLRRNVEFRYGESDFLQKLIPNQRITVGTNGAGFIDANDMDDAIAGGRKFTDIRLELRNNKGGILIVKGYGAKALSLDTNLLTDTGVSTIGECQVGDKVYGPSGNLTTITHKSRLFYKSMYQITLEDGRQLKVSKDHINSVVHKENVNNKAKYRKKDLTTLELLQLDLQYVRCRTRETGRDYTSKENLLFIENNQPLIYQEKDLPIDPYTLGLLLGDGSLKKNGSVVLHAAKDDMLFYKDLLPYEFGSWYADKRNLNVISLTLKNLSSNIRELSLAGHGVFKFIPYIYFFGSIKQRVELLQGLMDSDGSIQKNGRMDFCSNSQVLVNDVSNLVRSLGGTTKKRKVNKAYRIEIWISINIFKLPRKSRRFTGTRLKPLVAIKSIESIPIEPSQCIAVDNQEHQFLVNQYIRTHNTGVRGAKELGKRPQVAVLDDLVSDTDAESPTVIKTIENTVYKAVSKALHPTNQKIIWCGTPFNARDPLYKAVESGAWKVRVYPICEHFPCSEEDFKGSWEDRFPYTYVLDEYEEAQSLKLPENFNQELMLRIMSDEDRLINDDDIQEFDLESLLKNKSAYNYYITTDFATSEEQSSDFSVIVVWALNWQGYWYMVDGICKKQLMDANIDDLFRLAQKWRPLSVGVEVSGQQNGFISWIQREMLTRNINFNLASENNLSEKGVPKPGIRPTTNKMVRFNIILPWFKQKKIALPKIEDTIVSENIRELVVEAKDELSLASKGGFKSKNDDFIDNTSMLGSLTVFRPSEPITMHKNKDNTWEVEDEESGGSMDSYLC